VEVDWYKIATSRAEGELFRRPKLIKPGACFLFSTQEDGAPSGLVFSAWEWASNPKTMGRFLQCVAIPQALITCIEGLQIVDEGQGFYVSMEDVINQAVSNNAPARDIEVAKKLLRKLDSCDGLGIADVHKKLKALTKTFNDQFGEQKGHWSDITLEYFPNVQAAGKALFEYNCDEDDHLLNVEGQEFSRKQWTNLCSQVSKPEVQRVLTAAFEDDQF
jgi:hypothetical protein